MRANDPDYLLKEQYHDASNLSARARLHQRFSTNPHPWFHWYFEQLELPESARILELGCGPGGLWRENRERIPPAWDVVLTDFSPGMLEEARRNLDGLGRLSRFECVDAQAIPLADASCDAVLANHMLYHVLDRERAFAEIRRVLKPDGCLYAATNGARHLHELSELVRAALPSADTEQVSMYAAEFTLENGAAQLAPHFSDVRTIVYEDALRVTEVEPLIAYVLSSPLKKGLGAEQIERLRGLVAQRMDERGYIYIGKALGVFRARN